MPRLLIIIITVTLPKDATCFSIQLILSDSLKGKEVEEAGGVGSCDALAV